MMRWVAGAVLLVAAGGAAAKDAVAIGRVEFMLSCSQCHGLDGRGDGIIADYLTVPPPDLTTIRRDEGGVFPERVLAEIIEGGGGVGPHGSAEMPAWGARYTVEAHQELGWRLDPDERDAFVEERIGALVAYIASIQRD